MPNDHRTDAGFFLSGITEAAHAYWPILLFEGIALIGFGILALLIPPFMTLGIAIGLGWIFICSGIVALIANYYRKVLGFLSLPISAVLSILAGLALLVRPLSGAISLTVILDY